MRRSWRASRFSSLVKTRWTLTPVMPICKPSHHFAYGRLLGLDIGSKTIGVAVCDPDCSFASPLCTLKRQPSSQAVKSLEQLIKDNTANALVIGLPLNMNGSEGPRCQAARDFAAHFLGRCDVNIVFWDERLSTASAEQAMIEAGFSRRRRAQVIDQAAAAVILQNFLDYRRLHIQHK